MGGEDRLRGRSGRDGGDAVGVEEVAEDGRGAREAAGGEGVVEAISGRRRRRTSSVRMATVGGSIGDSEGRWTSWRKLGF